MFAFIFVGYIYIFIIVIEMPSLLTNVLYVIFGKFGGKEILFYNSQDFLYGYEFVIWY